MRGTTFAALTAGLGVAAGLAAATNLFPRPADPPEPVAPQTEYPLGQFSGKVVAVDERAVTVRGFAGVGVDGGPEAQYEVDPARGRSVTTGPAVRVRFPDRAVTCIRAECTRDRLTLTLADGRVEVHLRADQPLRKFPAAGPLAEGRYVRTGLAARTYRLADVRAGDEVSITCERVDGVDHCATIQIERRPGGRVPVAPGQKPGDRDVWHEQANAYQDFEERGIPLPEKYDPEVHRREGQLKRAKMMARLEAERQRDAERTAPPPREVPPKTPTP